MTTTLGQLGSGTFGAFEPQDLAPSKPKATPPVDVDQELIKAAESKGELEKARAQEELTSKEMLARGEEKTTKEYAKSIAEDPARAMLEEKIQERDRVKFVPTQENVKDLGLMFTLTNLLGFMIGGKSKGNAQAAMSAMNGMLEGHQKGLADQYKKEKDIYDENVKALDKTIDSLYKKIQDGVQLYATNRDAGLAEIRTAIAEHNANFLKDSLEKYGPAYAYDKIKTIKEMKDKKDLADERLRQHAEQIAHQKVQERQAEAQLAETKRYHDIEAAKQGKGGQTQQFMAQRAVNALGGLASAAENISQLPKGSTTGILSYLSNKPGMINFLSDEGARKISDKQAEAFDVLFTGVTRNLAAIEASGAATGLVGLASQMEKLIPKAGQSNFKSALQLADMRRVAVENITPLINSGLLNPQQKEEASRLVQRIETAIPYTTNDIVKVQFAGKPTLGESGAELAGKTPTSTYDSEKEARYQAWKKEHGYE